MFILDNIHLHQPRQDSSKKKKKKDLRSGIRSEGHATDLNFTILSDFYRHRDDFMHASFFSKKGRNARIGNMFSTLSLKYFERYHKLISKLQQYVQARPYHFNDSVKSNIYSKFRLINVLLLILNSATLRGVAQ